jgi:hypothetical protein
MEPEYVASVYKSAILLSKIGVGCDYTPMEAGIISEQRNALVKIFLDGGGDYLLFCDSDMAFDPLTVTEMLDAGKDIIGSLYRTREEPYLPVCYAIHPEKGEGYFRRLGFEEIGNESFICGAVGAGLMLIKRQVLEEMTRGEFVKEYGRPFNLWQRSDGQQIGEDMSFSMRARLAGYETWCYPSLTAGHVGSMVIRNNAVLTATFPHYSNDIEGWISATELNWLYQTAKGMDSIVEIGSWKGRSTLALLNGCHGPVYAVDTFKGSPEEQEGPHQEAVTGDIYSIFLRNVGNFKNVIPLQMTSEEAVNKVPPVDMAFVDGSHRYEDVKQDIELWRPKARKLICGHDYNWPDVAKAVDEAFEPDQIKLTGSIWYRYEN